MDPNFVVTMLADVLALGDAHKDAHQVVFDNSLALNNSELLFWPDSIIKNGWWEQALWASVW